MIRGFIEFIDEFEVRGWAFDSDDPGRYVMVAFARDAESLGVTTANIFRTDLLRAGMGAGYHGFAHFFRVPLDPSIVRMVRAEGRGGDGSRVELPHWLASPPAPADAKPPPRFSGVTSDAGQYPVFVLGSVRSGTTAMLQGLLKIERYRGFGEGHILDLMQPLVLQVEEFYRLKHLDRQRNTMIGRVPIEFVKDGFDHIFVDLIQQLFSEGHWVEKTPNVNAIRLAPRFRRIWPNARFIFMRRRALENLTSRARKFPAYDFARNCAEWRNAMQAWLSARIRLRGAAIEVDQLCFARHPERVAEALHGLLGLDAEEARLLARVFAEMRPEQTGATIDEVFDLTSVDWSASQIDEFNRVCRPVMEQFGYTTDRSYHRDGNDGGLVLI
jgi:hypothetical protein